MTREIIIERKKDIIWKGWKFKGHEGDDMFGLFDVTFIERTPFTHNVDHYKFSYNNLDEAPKTIPIMSRVLLRTPEGQKRFFTPIFNEDEGYIHLAIKNYDRTVSGELAQLEPGAEGIMISKPTQHIKHEVPLKSFKLVYLIGAGVGIAPLLGYMTSCLKEVDSQTKIKLIYANHSLKDIVLKQELNELKEKYPDSMLDPD
ncbi:unnamed protein product [Ambrosiozyma monospora]|uniref:Unnamed protein product n=1 Tax=Ambrosiozyma monospora TaxID=43982 RepID=A0ACB5TAA1_AMBMO|nr:unnamed protein product [Ambrosiozyma monospora]